MWAKIGLAIMMMLDFLSSDAGQKTVSNLNAALVKVHEKKNRADPEEDLTDLDRQAQLCQRLVDEQKALQKKIEVESVKLNALLEQK
ncbi:Uncharacterised protein [Streptococcus sanguinis]|jgi:hypothetical protein|uniref:Uncharacterized protein n=1 Tax=Streptococcus sanguinis TaxID=1305 RepID=A0A7H8V3U4_STRSA|nr:hypothetical protein [Streptococcus sanguinis]QLB50952.1 hypothetical protein FDP16_11035 [Streptococcus sanguinis]VDY72871.1 Uncharacterised protein [Streptococcus sanguinis]